MLCALWKLQERIFPCLFQLPVALGVHWHALICTHTTPVRTSSSHSPGIYFSVIYFYKDTNIRACSNPIWPQLELHLQRPYIQMRSYSEGSRRPEFCRTLYHSTIHSFFSWVETVGLIRYLCGCMLKLIGRKADNLIFFPLSVSSSVFLPGTPKSFILKDK